MVDRVKDATEATEALKFWHPKEDFDKKLGKIGTGRTFAWKKRYLSCTDQGYKIKTLNFFQRILRTMFGAYKDTHFSSLKGLKGEVKLAGDGALSDRVLRAVSDLLTSIRDVGIDTDTNLQRLTPRQ